MKNVCNNMRVCLPIMRKHTYRLASDINNGHPKIPVGNCPRGIFSGEIAKGKIQTLIMFIIRKYTWKVNVYCTLCMK